MISNVAPYEGLNCSVLCRYYMGAERDVEVGWFGEKKGAVSG